LAEPVLSQGCGLDRRGLRAIAVAREPSTKLPLEPTAEEIRAILHRALTEYVEAKRNAYHLLRQSYKLLDQIEAVLKKR